MRRRGPCPFSDRTRVKWRANSRSFNNPLASSLPTAAAAAEGLFLDGELAEISHAEVERHVEVCKACYPRFQFERNFLDALQAAEERGTASPELKDRILKVLAEESASDSP